MTRGDNTQVNLVPAQPTELGKAARVSLAGRARADLQISETAEQWLRKGIELHDTAPSDPWNTGPINPNANRAPDLATKLLTVIPRYIDSVLAGTLPEVAARSLGMTPDDQELAHVAHFFMPETLKSITGNGQMVVLEPNPHSKPSAESSEASSSLAPTNNSGVPSPAGMDDGTLTQATVEKMGHLILEIETTEQRQEEWRRQLERRNAMLEEAYQCFEHGREMDPTNPGVMFWLAESLFWGHGVQRDQELAMGLYHRAAEMGHAGAQSAIIDIDRDGG